MKDAMTDEMERYDKDLVTLSIGRLPSCSPRLGSVASAVPTMRKDLETGLVKVRGERLSPKIVRDFEEIPAGQNQGSSSGISISSG